MARFWLCTLLIFLLLPTPSPVRINTHGSQFFTRRDILVEVFIVRRPQNRVLDIVWGDSASEIGRSEKTLDGDAGASIFRITLHDLDAGEYEVRARLIATDRVDDAQASFNVIAE